MKQVIVAFAAGFSFAMGLGISGMTKPENVFSFLDLFGSWNPALMFVMGGAVLVHVVTYMLIRRRKQPVVETQWHVPTSRTITPALVIGSVLFGMGWALGGFCPGPALASLGSMEPRSFMFVISMLGGMVLFRMLDQVRHIKR